MGLNKKTKAYIISIVIGQIIALLMWFFIEKNYFLGMLLGSIIAILFGYRESKNNNVA